MGPKPHGNRKRFLDETPFCSTYPSVLSDAKKRLQTGIWNFLGGESEVPKVLVPGVNRQFIWRKGGGGKVNRPKMGPKMAIFYLK